MTWVCFAQAKTMHVRGHALIMSVGGGSRQNREGNRHFWGIRMGGRFLLGRLKGGQ